MAKRTPRKPPLPPPPGTADEEGRTFTEQARLRARRELLEEQRRRLQEIKAFEQRLATLGDVPGWKYVRALRRQFLHGVVGPQERFFSFLLLHQKALLYEVRLRADHLGRRNVVLGAAFWTIMSLPFMVLWGLVWVQNRIYAGLVRSERLFARGVVALPGTIQSGYEATVSELRQKEGLRGLRRAILDEEGLTPQRRRALLFLAVVMGATAWLLAEILLRLLDPSVLPYKHRLDVLFLYGVATRLLLPTPLEVLLPGTADELGAVLAVLVAAAGGVVGTWVLYLVGDKANQGLDKWADRRAWTRRVWAWTRRNAERFGYAIMGLILAIPFAPDSVTAVFAVLGLRLRWFLLTAFAATVVRLSLFLVLWR